MTATSQRTDHPKLLSRLLAQSGFMLASFALILVCTFAFASSFSTHSATQELDLVSFIQDESESTNEDTTDQPIDQSTGSDGSAVLTAPKYHARVVEFPENGFTTIGDIENTDEKIAIEFNHQGAGISSIKLPDDFETVAELEHVTLQRQVEAPDGSFTMVPFCAVWVNINNEPVLISGSKNESVWAELSPGVFEAYVDDADGNPILRIEREIKIKSNDEHGFTLQERVENLSNIPLAISLVTTGPIDMPKAQTTYAGDRRRVRYGFLQSQERQGTSLKVHADEELKSRNKLLGKKTAATYGKAYPYDFQVWPNEELLPNSSRLSWLALSDRYFMVSMHPLLDESIGQTPEQRLLEGYSTINRIILDGYANPLDAVFVLELVGKEQIVAPNESMTRAMGVYTGPRNRPMLSAESDPAALNMPSMVVSNLGGICAPCTFGWLTDILIGVLRTFHSIVGDWAISIFLLVIVVRTCLHPVTRWSQIRVQRFSVQMQAMAPKQKQIGEKYKNDPKKKQAEMGKLWREEGISPAGMLGCLPMFLQSPVWIALYATLFFASELRHEPAFYGIFQQMGGWGFMNDLAAPDGAIPLPAAMHFSFPMWGNVDSVNILPLMLGFVMYAHQKFLTPPTQATMTPEQQSQQKMMKVMTIVLFPVMMYAAPSGLALYFITNSTVAVVENKWIRAHMKKHGMLEIENIRASKKDKGPGFLQRMTDAAEAQRQIRDKGPAQPNPASKNSRRGKM